MPTRHELTYQIRYAVRLTQRTARLYRRTQSIGVFLSIIGGSGTLSLLANSIPNWVGLTGGIILAVTGAAMVSIRPADKAAQNESDMRRYLALMQKSHTLTDAEIATAIDEAHQSDCPELEPLRDVAFNDIVTEFGRQDAAVELSTTQKLFALLA